MKDLKKYKALWKEQKHRHQTVDKKELATMIKGKSSSLVKWIFIISLIEFSVFLILDIFSHPSLILPPGKEREMKIFTYAIDIAGYGIMLYFIIRFYFNYKRIQVTLSVKDLMYSIIRTRRTVRNYIIANISLLVAGTITGAYILLQSDEYKEITAGITGQTGINGVLVAWVMISVLILSGAGFIILLYYLLYGLIIKRLMRNYKDLSE